MTDFTPKPERQIYHELRHEKQQEAWNQVTSKHAPLKSSVWFVWGFSWYGFFKYFTQLCWGLRLSFIKALWKDWPIRTEPWDAGQGLNDLEKVIPVCPCFILTTVIILPSVFYILWQVSSGISIIFRFKCLHQEAFKTFYLFIVAPFTCNLLYQSWFQVFPNKIGTTSFCLVVLP